MAVRDCGGRADRWVGGVWRWSLRFRLDVKDEGTEETAGPPEADTGGNGCSRTFGACQAPAMHGF